jgi:hypothetical protein
LLLLLSFAMLAASAGCGDDDDDGDGGGGGGGGVSSGSGSGNAGDGGGVPTEEPEDPVDDGCTADVPTRVYATKHGYDGWLILCVTDDRRVLRIQNTSGNSFFVWATDGNTRLRMTAVPPTTTFAGYLASSAVRPGDPDGNGYWILTPASTLVATNAYGPTGVLFQLSPENTAAYNAAHSGGAYVDRLAISRSRALVGKGLACADSASNAIKAQDRLDVALAAINVRRTCQGFLNDAIQREGQVGDDTQTAWRRFLAFSKRLAGGNFDDELAYGIARLAHR